MICRLTCRHVSKLLKSHFVTHVRYIGFSYLSVSCAMGAVSDRLKLSPAPEAVTPSGKTTEHLTIHGQSVTTHAAQSEDIVKGETLIARNVQTIFGLQYLTPSLQVTPQFASGQPGYTIRGLGFNDYASNNAAAVGISINGVAQTLPFLTGGLMADIATVTIHRGPQGYEGGRSVSAGLIDYRTYQPEAQPACGAHFQYGRFGSMVVDGHASGQVAPRWVSRISFESRQGGAWQVGPSGADFGNNDQSVARLINRIQVHDALTLSLDVHGLYDRSDGMGLHRFTPLTTMETNKRGPVLPADHDRRQTWWGTSPSFARMADLQPGQKPFHHVSSGGGVFTLEEKFAGARLEAVTGFDAGNRREYDNFGAAIEPVANVAFNTRASTLVQSLRLISASSSRFHWETGLWFNRQTLSDQYLTGFAASYGFNRSVTYRQTGMTIAGFGKVRYDLIPTLSLNAAVRVDHENRALHDYRAYTHTLGGVITNPGNVLPSRSLTYTLPTGMIGLDYHPTSHLQVYASARRGMKSGGFTAYNSTNVALSTTPFRAEQLWAFETGARATLPAWHLTAELSAFYNDLHDEQVQSAILDPTVGLLGAIVNAPRAHISGGEFNLRWSPWQHVLITQGGGWAVGRYDDFTALFSAQRQNGVFVGTYQDKSGTHLPAPKLTLTGSIAYQIPVADWQVTPAMKYALRSTYRSLFGPLYNVNGYTIFGASLSVRPPHSHWVFAFFGDNIFNKQYDVDRNFFVAGDNVALAGMPASWGGRIACEF